METKDLKKYDQLSPFEVKDKLIELAQSHHERMMLDAGRAIPTGLPPPRVTVFSSWGCLP